MNERNTSIFETIKSTFGFFLISFLCGGVGLYMKGSLPPSFENTGMLAIFCFILTPYFYFREKTLEDEFNFQKFTRSVEFQFTIIVTVLILIIAMLMLFLMKKQGENYLNLIGYFTGIAPFIYMSARSINGLIIGNTKEKGFLYKVFFPALATCLMPMVFGWALIEQETISVLVAALYIVLLSEVSRKNKLTMIPFLSLIVISLIVFSMIVPSLKFGSVLVVGLIISLGMGVSEVGKRAYLISSNQKSSYKNEDAEYFASGATWASCIFPVLLTILPLLIIELPTLPVVAYAIFYIVIWQDFVQRKDEVMAFWVSVALGFMLPVILISSVLAAGYFGGLKSDYTSALYPLCAVPLAVAFFLPTFNRNFRPNRIKKNMLEKNICKSDKIMATGVFLLISVAITMVIIMMFSVFLSAMNEGLMQKYKIKENEILIGLIALIVVKFLVSWFSWNSDDSQGGTPGENIQKNIEASKNAGNIITRINVGRPAVSVIAGLFISFGMFLSEKASFGASLIAGLPMTLVTMYGFVVNDICDKEKDRIAEAKNKPIAYGAMSVQSAMMYAFLLVSLAFLVEFFSAGTARILILSSVFIGVSIYSYISRYFPIGKGVATAILCLAPIVYLSEAAGISVNIFVYPVFVFFIFGRELLMDSIEIAGDSRFGIKTLAYFMGADYASAVGWTFMLSATVSLFFILGKHQSH